MEPNETEPGATICLSGRISRSDVGTYCARARELFLRTEALVIICDAGEVCHPDAAAVDVIARLQLLALRCGRELRVVHAGNELRELLDLAGLSEVIAIAAD